MRAKGKNQQPNQPTCIDRIGGRTQAATTCEDASAPTPLSKVLRNSPIPFPPSFCFVLMTHCHVAFSTTQRRQKMSKFKCKGKFPGCDEFILKKEIC